MEDKEIEYIFDIKVKGEYYIPRFRETVPSLFSDVYIHLKRGEEILFSQTIYQIETETDISDVYRYYGCEFLEQFSTPGDSDEWDTAVMAIFRHFNRNRIVYRTRVKLEVESMEYSSL